MIWTTPQPYMKVGRTLRVYRDNVMYYGGVHNVYAIQIITVKGHAYNCQQSKDNAKGIIITR